VAAQHIAQHIAHHIAEHIAEHISRAPGVYKERREEGGGKKDLFAIVFVEVFLPLILPQ